MLVSAPNRGIILPPTFLIPAYNVPRPTPTLASDYNLTPTSGVIHTSHSPLPPQTQSYHPYPLHFLAPRQGPGGNIPTHTSPGLSPGARTKERVMAALASCRKDCCRFVALVKKFCSSWFGKNNSKVIMLNFLF